MEIKDSESLEPESLLGRRVVADGFGGQYISWVLNSVPEGMQDQGQSI